MFRAQYVFKRVTRLGAALAVAGLLLVPFGGAGEADATTGSGVSGLASGSVSAGFGGAGSVSAGFVSAKAAPHIQLRGPGVEVGEAWLGSYRTFSGEPWAWCIDAGKNPPFGHFNWKAREVQAPQEAYLLWKYSDTATKTNHAAMSFLLHKSDALPHETWWSIPKNAPALVGAPLVKRVKQLQGAAADFAGPYEIRASFVDSEGEPLGAKPSVVVGEPVEASIKIEVLSASGKAVSGVPISVTVGEGEGKAAVRAGKSLVSSTKPVTVPVIIEDVGEIEFQLSAQVPPTKLRVHESQKPDVQRVVTSYGADRVEARIGITGEEPLEIAVETQTSESAVEGGGLVHDILDVSVVAGQWLEELIVPVESTLYGPFEAAPDLSDEVPVESPVVATVTTEVSGPGQWSTDEVEVTEPGWYVWHEVVQSGPLHRGWVAQFGIEAETFEVVEITPELVAEPEPEPEPETEPEPEVEPVEEPVEEPEVEPEPELVKEAGAELEPEVEVELESGGEIVVTVQEEPRVEVAGQSLEIEPGAQELPRTGGSLALLLIGGGTLLTGVGTVGATRGGARSATSGRRVK